VGLGAEGAVGAVLEAHEVDLLALVEFGVAEMDHHAAGALGDDEAFLLGDAGHAAVVEEVFCGEDHIADLVLDCAHGLTPTRRRGP